MDGSEKDGGGLGEDHEGEQVGRERRGEGRGAERPGCRFPLLRRGVGGGQKSEQGEKDQHGLEDGHAGEGITEGADRKKEDGNRRSQGADCSLAVRGDVGRSVESSRAVEEKVGREKDEGEDADREGAGGGEVDAGEAEESSFE